MSSRIESTDATKNVSKNVEGHSHIVDLAKPVTENSPFNKAPDPKDLQKLADTGFPMNKFSVIGDEKPKPRPPEEETRMPPHLQDDPNRHPRKNPDGTKSDLTTLKEKLAGGAPDAKLPADTCVYFPDTDKIKGIPGRNVMEPPPYRTLESPGKLDTRTLKEKWLSSANASASDVRHLKDKLGPLDPKAAPMARQY